MKKPNIAFATCVRLGRSCIEKIIEMGGPLSLLITLRDDKAAAKSGRVYIDDIAETQGLPLLKVRNINDPEVHEAVREMEIDWLFVIGWSQIVRPQLLSLPRKGCVGMHPTLLPEGRGRAAVPWAILNGLEKTGVSMFLLDEGVDTGDILGQVEIPLSGKTTAAELYEKVEGAHVLLIEKYWKQLLEDSISAVPQDETKATVWGGRRPEDGEILPEMTMAEAERMVRAVTHPYPGAFFVRSGRKVTVWSAETGDVKMENAFGLADGYLYPVDYETGEWKETEDGKEGKEG